MKTRREHRRCIRRLLGFTLPELMITASLFILMTAGFISANMFALRQDELVNSKLGANDQSRLSLTLLLSEIRGCKDVQVGTGSSNSFTSVTNGAVQQGSCLQITPSLNTSMWIRYYFRTNGINGELWRVSSVTTNGIRILTGLTNSTVFQVFDYTGTNVLTVIPTNYNYNYAVGATFQFYQYQYPLTYVGPQQYYNYYKLGFKVARRAP